MSNDSSSGNTEPKVAHGEPMASDMDTSLAAKKKAHWGPLAALVYSLLAFIGAQMFAYVALYTAVGLFGYTPTAFIDTIAGQFTFILLAEALTIAAIVGYVRYRGGTLAELGITKLRLHYVGYALGGYAVYFVAYIVVITLASVLVPSLNLDQQQDIGFKDPLGSWELVLTFISLVVLPPLAEETLFRGFMFKGLRNKLPFIYAAIITSALFAVGHLEFGGGQPLLWVAAIDTFILSLVLTFFREKTGSIWTGVFIHAIKNAVAFSVLYIFTR